MASENLKNVKSWFAEYKKELDTLDPNGFIASSSIEWLIKEVERLMEQTDIPNPKEGIDLKSLEKDIAMEVLKQLKMGLPVRSMDERGVYDYRLVKDYITDSLSENED